MPSAPRIEACREATPDWTPVYDLFVAKLRRSGVGTAAPELGSTFPDFALPNARGRYRSLAELTREGPIVLSFNRGGWCPYCRTELTSWGEHAEELAGAGGSFVSVAAETGGRAEQLHALVGERAEVLVDVDHGLALTVGLAFRCDEDLQRRYLSCGLDLSDLYGSGTWFLPVPATFVVDREQRVRYAFVDADFRNRADPSEVIDTLRALT